MMKARRLSSITLIFTVMLILSLLLAGEFTIMSLSKQQRRRG
jgi:hypothetical protein